MTARRNSGFTLLEVLVALVVLGMVLAGLAQGIQFGLAASGRQGRMVLAQTDRDAALRTLRGVLERLDPVALVRGTAHGLVFSSALPPGAGVAAGEADLLLQVDSQRRLVLRWTPHLHAERFGNIAVQDVVLLAEIDRLDLSYRPRGEAPNWVSTWDNAAPPALIRLRLVPAGAGARPWPDLVVAPMRDRGGR